ncbi:GTP-binding protein [Methanohalophilus euhalobius]|uniref:GTP-binding protein n=1 Tax=Methanohalophilus euhalobius TaxID=51203 RepID=A0A285F716_9EURY|nr:MULTISPECIES: Era-like GTP-binding protein [Methanohalophilus]ODV50090.1 MAG: GTP-binding protein [Methanohalophilus sp. 2-GBenrich]RSD36288.1 MAG: GTP-binding protein [Methanohalophilus sp.]TCL12221.1 GTP-binding protein [Methanohalophilus euhalobius]SNY07067.1 GTP-binding protein [Methanohalophilus euhalobius]
MGVIRSLKRNFTDLLKKLLNKKSARIGIYGPPNAGKTTLANRILRDWTGDAMGSVSNVAHETRRARRREGVTIKGNGNSLSLDIIDTPGLATKIDFHEFMEQGMSEAESKRRAKEATEGVIEAVKWLENLDGIILVMDATEDPFTQVNVTVIGNMEARGLPLLIAANKIDREDSSPSTIREAFPQHPLVAISALEGKNIDTLYEEIAKRFG